MIHVILDGRGTGKTTKLIKEASKTGAIIVTENESKADNVRIMAEKMHLQIRPPISWNKYVTFYRFLEKNSPYVFDDISSIVRDELFSLLISNLPSSGEASSAAQIFDIEAMNSSLENVDFVDMSGKKLSVKIVVGYKRQEEDIPDIPEEEAEMFAGDFEPMVISTAENGLKEYERKYKNGKD